MSSKFDAIVIGAGQSGPFLAARLAAAGKTVALVERKFLGGTCVNVGCMPTKTMVASAYAAHLARRASDYGVTIGGDIGIDMKKVKARKDKVTLDARHGLESWFEGMKNCTVIFGHASFASPHEIEVDGQRLTADQIFLNVGGRATIPDMPGIEDVPYLTNSSILALDTIPEHLVVIGGSYIGLEFGQMFRRFGAKVTVVERNARLISKEDSDVSEAVHDILRREDIDIHVGAGCIGFERRGKDIAVLIGGEGNASVVGSHVLLAVGRRPNTDDLGLDKAGVETDERGYIKVDDKLQTNVPGIWALGDCNGRGAFTHTSYNDFEIAAANLIDGGDRRISDRHPAYALYIDPPLGRVGMTEAEVRRSGRKALIGTRPMTKVGRAVEKGETLGFMKILADAETGEILGASLLGTGGDEAVHALIDAIYAKATTETLKRAVHIHPTVSELIPTVIEGMQPLT
ncbi:FAD-containing oxidoreductase [Rhizobium sp. BK376]|uniref:FAD-containing oxidoreductase n=1 Tax=Rhizobium sp. BK376 TaxID=2512149 RepID=UPI00104CC62F|nr:FAD-containing oxidoreductase [Rhizobium sp. BK376]TCR81460.1 pyruvate/2-oxoglutarate dehydrogenase complex dihydrolipoamide dehydrogenase (E3) component [Rhizobium sp. BK376]